MLRYNRSELGSVATQLVERSTFNELGQPANSQDARFFAQEAGPPTLNFQNTPALSGQMLQTVSVDAGKTQVFHDIAGRPIWQRDARGTVQTFTYDALGRRLTRWEQLPGATTSVMRERWLYTDAQDLPPYTGAILTDPTDPRNANLCGQLVNHYDTAGLLDTGTWQDQTKTLHPIGYTLQGLPQQQGRTLLLPETASDWGGNDESVWQAKFIDKTIYKTTWAYNALGQVLTQTDARGHLQSTTYDIAGRKYASSVRPSGKTTQVVIQSITYAPGGQILCRTDANGVTTTHTYEAQRTQRVLALKVIRAGQDTLQDLAYTYDPVGNVSGVADSATPVSFFRNRAVTAGRTYTYDALYQLITASGRENNASNAGGGTDTPTPFLTLDPSNYRDYTRTYAYDLGGNLTQIGSTVATGAAPPMRKISVDAASNRAVSNANASAVTAKTVGDYFDEAGNANCLDGNKAQPLSWTGLNQLGNLVTVQRDGGLSQCDRESYAYGGDGHRVRKTGFAQVSGSMSQRSDAIYLPGLEIRAQIAGEQLEVIVLDDGARMLNWTSNQPSDVPNQQVRYRYTDRQDSCQIELDQNGTIITQEEYYPYGGTAVMAAASTGEAKYKTIRYSGKERDAAGLYYYGFRYYQPWIGRWISTDPAGTVDGLNLYRMVGSNPATFTDMYGAAKSNPSSADSQRPVLPNRIDTAKRIVALMQKTQRTDRRDFCPRKYFGGKVRFHIDDTQSPYLVDVGGHPTQVNFNAIAHKAMARLSETAKVIGVEVVPEKNAKKANLMIRVEDVVSGELGATIPYGYRRKFPKISITPDYVIAQNLTASLHCCLRGDQASMASLVRGQIAADSILRRLTDSERTEIAELSLLSTITHEGGHAIFRLGHPETVAENMNQAVFDEGHRSGTMALQEAGKEIKYRFYIHEAEVVNIMSRSEVGGFSTHILNLIKHNFVLSELSINLSENEKESIFKEFKDSASLGRRRARIPSCLRGVSP
ncbi:RHS repeat-associated core domain-containing protein [Achromobacter seleniivolatilans]|uniref:RHS repeat-associated core domain-containing protein n=1 Tax=Achromobacter seleniivolatilans TaxID=3047478 RepID=A0ABY9M540_9BURK|nr:RHS repeat-associated core domain-containing protein [Achromobacter sp. R39]WMD21738.1 RHS repeat-associated core domain-containing protein [Achromobacter sp. R39]